MAPASIALKSANVTALRRDDDYRDMAEIVFTDGALKQLPDRFTLVDERQRQEKLLFPTHKNAQGVNRSNGYPS